MLDFSRFFVNKFKKNDFEEKFLLDYFNEYVHLSRLTLIFGYFFLFFPMIFKFNSSTTNDSLIYIIIYIFLFLLTFGEIVYTYNDKFYKIHQKTYFFTIISYSVILSLIVLFNLNSQHIFFSCLITQIIILMISQISFKLDSKYFLYATAISLVLFNIASLFVFFNNSFFQNGTVFIFINIFVILSLSFVYFHNIFEINRYRNSFITNNEYKKNKEFLEIYSQNSFEGFFIVKNSIIVFVNDVLLNILNYQKEDVINKDIKTFLLVENDKLKGQGHLIKSNGESIEIEVDINEFDEYTKYSIFDNREIIELKEKYKMLYEENSAIHIIIDSNYIIHDLNNTVEKFLKIDKLDLLNSNINQIIEPEDIETFDKAIENAFLEVEEKNGIEIRFLDYEYKTRYFLLYFSTFHFNDNQPKVYINGVDITDRKNIEEKLCRHANYDTMTEVLNRRMGLEYLNETKNLADKNNEIFSICFIDINGLKMVNDLYGHNEGDELIKIVGEALKTTLRGIDFVARMGGDEFLLILPEFKSENGNKLWSRIQDILDEISEMKPYDISASYGFAEYNPEEPTSIEKLIESADNEMYIYKQNLKKEKANISLKEIKKELNEE